MNICQFCGAEIPENGTCRSLYDQLAFYTLAHQNRQFFIHQLIVDAYGAQHATDETKPIAETFALIGLYLFSEKNYTGRQVQIAHIELGQIKRDYPRFLLPEHRGNIHVGDILRVIEGLERDEKIKEWAKMTWEAFRGSRIQVIRILLDANFKEIL